MSKKFKAGILGASGYVGAELIRILTTHPAIEITALTADRKAGARVGAVFPHLEYLDFPVFLRNDDLDISALDVIFSALPHGIIQEFSKALPAHVKLIDCSADFRLREDGAYERWYGSAHQAPDLQKKAVYGLPEFYRDEIAKAQIVANTGCYVVTSLLPLVPLLEDTCIDPARIVIDAASGVSGAGRQPSEGLLFSELNDSFKAYSMGQHRHMGELDQELSKAASQSVKASFSPHLLPQNRGILATIYVRGEADRIHEALAKRYKDERFVHVKDLGQQPATKHVLGSNNCLIGVERDRDPSFSIITSVTDNLMKGAAGQAVQCANLALGLDEAAGLMLAPVFP